MDVAGEPVARAPVGVELEAEPVQLAQDRLGVAVVLEQGRLGELDGDTDGELETLTDGELETELETELDGELETLELTAAGAFGIMRASITLPSPDAASRAIPI